jgi:spore germination protein YaaH
VKRLVKIGGLLLLFLICFALILSLVRLKVRHDLKKPPISSVSPTVIEQDTKATGRGIRSVFVPYWTLNRIPIGKEYDQAIYFGITPTLNGINTAEPGYNALDTFHEEAVGKEKILTLRMLDNTNNFKIIENKNTRTKVIQEALNEAKNGGFNGVLLDLEVSVIPFESVTKNIATFITEFNTEAERQGIDFYIAIYGDNFYRLRPFDVKTISENADMIMIMAYDFHKARSNPGPNFPLDGKEIFGYDFKSMIDNFTRQAPRQKLAVIFGLFGYDWTVDENGKGTETAKPLSYYEISEKFLKNCTEKDCVVTRDPVSTETKITYTDAEGKKHIVWFEDMESVRKKEEFLKKRGINNISFWSHSYF